MIESKPKFSDKQRKQAMERLALMTGKKLREHRLCVVCDDHDAPQFNGYGQPLCKTCWHNMHEGLKNSDCR